jgi:hypothetical protein
MPAEGDRKAAFCEELPDTYFGGAMKKLLNTLFVSKQGTYLAKEGDAAIVKVAIERLYL